MSEKIKATMILEMIGRPPEHMVKVLNEIIDKMNDEKKVEVYERKVKEPTLLKDQKDLYSAFAEIEVEVEEIMYLIMLVFKYKPSHVEVLSPEFIKLQNNDLGEVLSEITRKIHIADSTIQAVQIQNQQMVKKVKEFMEKKKSEEKV